MTIEGTTASALTSRTIVNLNELFHDLLALRVNKAHSGAVTLTVDLAADLPSVCVNPLEIQNVLSMLVGNAEEAIGDTPERPGQIHVKTSGLGDRVQVSITDNGRGLDWRDMARLFGDQSRDAALTLCAETVKDNGGDLYAWSRYGNGSVFTVDLPVHREAENAEKLPGASELRGKRILVIDDEVQISTLMSDVLQQHGAEIQLENSALAAVERIRVQPYDLYICDQRMPDLSGEHLFRSVESENPALRHKFLFVTGDALNQETEQFFAETGVSYIRKPFRMVELVAAAEQVLSRDPRRDF